MKRWTPSLLAALLAALIHPWALAADTAKVDGDGAVHSIRSEPWSQGNNSGGTVLVHVTQAPDGTESTAFIPGTGNFTLEKDPCLDMDPVTNTPVVVWAQVTDRATALFAVRWIDGAWGAPRMIWSDGALNLEPEIDVRDNLIHVKWKREGHEQAQLRLSLDREKLNLVFGPEELPIESASLAPPGADSGSAQAPGLDLSYFASVIPPLVPDQPGRIITWGIRDEPVPVVYFQPFQLPLGIQNVRECDSGWLEGRFVTWFTSGPSFFYTSLHEGEWDELRVIDLGDGRSTAEALLLLHDLIRR